MQKTTNTTKTIKSRKSLKLRSIAVAVIAICGFAATITACGNDSATTDRITLYSGRSEELIAPLIDDFTADSGIEVDVRYGDSAELALLIQTEGDNTPADVFISQSPGALGFLAGENRLSPLSDELTARVDAGFAASDRTWVGLTGRVRVLVYNSNLVDPADLPTSVLDLTDPSYRGQVGVAPANGSFQDFVTAMRNELGDLAARNWLEGMAAIESPNYPKNSAIVEAVGRGEIPMGLVNHYYNLRALEADPSVASRNHFFSVDDIGSLVVVTAGAVLSTSDASTASESLLNFLLSDDAQTTFAEQTQEYPLVAGTAAPAGLPSLQGYAAQTIDYDLLGDGLLGTIELIRESGIER
ncbi:MAG: extracellular solute-binding protein [Acidimicrobiia bacterium]|nr:extracellular solute-binding protein [Acidimicrobiia bacterium]MCY4458134.1 extracellular solute-binding protein [Acidimicrobiaceae bacterium]